MPVARIVGGIGRVLVTAGLVLLLFVAYQLWGTGFAEAQAQDDLRDAFSASLGSAPAPAPAPAQSPAVTGAPTAPGTDAPGATAPATTSAPEPPVGTAVAILRIPRIGVDKAVVEGVGIDDLRKGPGHYPSTPLPGEAGNAAIAGHRTTYGAPFGDLGELGEGDEILVTTRAGEFRYVVDQVSVVSPAQVEVLAPTTEARLTLTTCHPKYSARQRLVISGVLAGPAAAPDAAAPPTSTPPDDAGDGGGAAAGGTTTTAAASGEDAAAALDDPSLAGDPSARVPATAWAAVTGAVALAAWAVGRRWRRLPSYAAALPFGALALFQCFEHVARMLPANI